MTSKGLARKKVKRGDIIIDLRQRLKILRYFEKVP